MTTIGELHWQSIDAIDLSMSRVNFSPKSAAAQNRMEAAVNQLTASARQLVACEIDSSIPQGMALACELAGKAVLLHAGADPKLLPKIRHNLIRLHEEICTRIPSPADATVRAVIGSLPEYVDVRYDAPHMIILDTQNIFRKAMFVVADFLRITNHDQVYWRAMLDTAVPSRIWT